VSANRGQWFYEGILTTAANFTANSFKFNSGLKTLRIKNDGAQSLIFSVKGADDNANDGEVLAGEDLIFRDIQSGKIAVRNGSGSTTCRIWAY
jgi:hypothetical protein